MSLCPHSLANFYHFKSNFLRYSKVGRGSGLVNMSAIWSFVLICWILIWFVCTQCRKWWYCAAMCLVRGRSLCCVASSRAPTLSSKTRQCTVGESLLGIGAPYFSNSFTSSIRNITSLSAVESATHSASVVLKAMVVCILLDHKIGQLACMMT